MRNLIRIWLLRIFLVKNWIFTILLVVKKKNFSTYFVQIWRATASPQPPKLKRLTKGWTWRNWNKVVCGPLPASFWVRHWEIFLRFLSPRETPEDYSAGHPSRCHPTTENSCFYWRQTVDLWKNVRNSQRPVVRSAVLKSSPVRKNPCRLH